MKFIVRIAIIALVIGGGYLFRDRLTGNAGELKVGDCFDVPTGTTDVKDVQHHPCAEAHSGEVFFVGDLPAPKGEAFSEPRLEAYLVSTCAGPFKTYLGTASFTTTSSTIDVGAFYPNSKDWQAGERSVTCYLYRIDGSMMTQSLKVG